MTTVLNRDAWRGLTGFRSFPRKHGRFSNGALEKSVCATLPTKFYALSIPFWSTSGRRLSSSPLIQISMAEKKQPQCVLIGGQKSFRIRLLGQSSHIESMRIYLWKVEVVGAILPRDPDTKAAFLYYSKSPERPRIGGELRRLRLTSNNDPSSFESGSDLLPTDGLPWSRPLYVLLKKFLPLYEKLREDRFILDDLDRALLTLPSAKLTGIQFFIH